MTTLLLLASLLSPPLDLPWGEKLPKHFNSFKDYRYILGDISWGKLVFSRKTEDFETELLLVLSNDYIAEATLIIGPSGLSVDNCFSQYKTFLKTLTFKYGSNYIQKIIVDPLINDLFFVRRCHALKVGLEEYSTTWDLPDFKIELLMFGDEYIFIEITYTYKKQLKSTQKSKLLKSL